MYGDAELPDPAQSIQCYNTDNLTRASSIVDRPPPAKFIRRRKSFSSAKPTPEVNNQVESWQKEPEDEFDREFLKLVESLSSDQIVSDLNLDRLWFEWSFEN